MSELLIDYATIAVILCLGIFVQAAAGFAGGMLIVPLLMWFGYSIPAAQVALLIATIPQNLYGVWALRSDISVRQLAIPGLARVAFFPLGIWVLARMESLPSETLRQIVGGFILAATLATILIRPTPRPSIHPLWSWVTFPISGMVQGMVGMGGPVMVFWVQAHDWNTRQSRGFLFAMYLISIVPAILILWLAFGNRLLAPAVIATCSIPLLWIATHLGLKVGSWLGRKRLRIVTLGLLLMTGIAGLAAPWMR
ncbi:Sulfite exporter TauE/SafE [Rubripirellula obstinata]|uniref:Probable membrane transporter protein n=1 Tax=Rubripirellula obstinata TaxID=406547 RepID=A0A5B1CIP9_9BACT|nr:sulfite exporter TauE/SafE family protein [Rubripirellula obstinata]KAA1259785.1 Sulfite exporter TauE/SafE [Rubripirellula obstinata]